MSKIKIKKKLIFIFILVFTLVFSNLTPQILKGIGLIKLSDNFKINEARAAISRVNSTTCANAGATTIACTVAAPTNGNTLVAVIGTRGAATGRVTSITETGVTWVRAVQTANTNGVTSEIWYALNISGAGATVTVNLIASLKASAIIAEYSNVTSISALDQTALSTGNNANPGTGTTPTTAQADEVWVGGLAAIGTPTWSSPINSFSIIASAESTTGNASTRNTAAYLDRVVSATGAAATAATLSTSAQWAGVIATLKQNALPTLSISQPDGVSDMINVGDTYSITYSLNDPDNAVTVAFYYDTNNSGLDGVAITGPCATAVEGTNVTCAWVTNSVPAGTYYIYGITDDGVNPQVSVYSSGIITINSVGPDATTYTNTETALNYANCATTGCGGRISEIVTISGTSFGTPTSRDICTAGATNGCVRIGSYTVPAASISSWTATQIIFTVPSGITVFGGSGATCGVSGSGLCVTQNGVNDAGGALEFWVFPDITFVSPLGAGEGKEGDSVTLTGNRFDTIQGVIVFQNCFTSDVSAAINTWSDTSITATVPAGIADNDDSCDIRVTRAAGTGSKTDTSTNFTVLPSITAIAAPDTNAAREYSASDTDGLIMLAGSHFGAAGSATILGSTATQHLSAEGSCSSGGYGASTICLEVPTAISDSLYTGNIVLTRTSDSKSNTYNNFRLLPRIISLAPNSGVETDAVQINGNHFCETGTCPTAGNRNTAADNIKFYNGVNIPDADVSVWTHTQTNVLVPTGAATGNVILKSNNYDSNGSTFTVLSATPGDPTSLGQYKNDAITAITTGGGTNETAVKLKMTMDASVNDTLYPQVEVKIVTAAFDEAGVLEGTGVSYTGTPVVGTVSAAGLLNGNSYHWRARIRRGAYYSNWINFGGNAENPPTDPADIDFYIDTAAPIITLGSDNTCATAVSSVSDLAATIIWLTNENSTSQVEYGTDSNLAGSALFPSSPSDSVVSHSVSLSGLTAANTYYFRVRSIDALGNEGISPASSPYCSFTTTTAVVRPMKTIEYYINQNTSLLTSPYASPTVAWPFIAYIGETSPVIKSAFVEVNGVSAGDAEHTVTVQVNTANELATILASSSATEAFTVLYNIPAPDANLIIANPSSPDISNDLKITLSGASNTSLLSAKLILTYYYTP